MSHSRFGHATTTFLLALVIAIFSITSLGATSAPSAGEHSSQVAKKKKCKKGYKKKTVRKNGKKRSKCVKKKTKTITSETVASVTLGEVDTRSMVRKLPVTIKLKKAVSSMKVTVYAKRGPRTISNDVTVQFAAGELEKSVVVSLNEYGLLIDRQLQRFKTTRWAEADGIKSNVR